MTRPFRRYINFEHVTLTVTFGLLLKKNNIGHNFFILKDWVFKFDMCVPYDKTFPTIPTILNIHICDIDCDL